MFRATFGGYPVCDPGTEAQNLARLGKPVPPEFARCNSIFNQRGPTPARGWLLMLRADIDQLDLNELQTLTIEYEDEKNPQRVDLQTLNLYQLIVCKEPLNLTPSNVANDPTAVYLVEIADSRWRVHNPYFQTACEKYYNVPAGLYGGGVGSVEYMMDSLNPDDLDGNNLPTRWTWQAMLDDLWTLLEVQFNTVGAQPPRLPFSPDGYPESFAFVGVSAWTAYNQILERIGCEFALELVETAPLSLSIVQVGADDTYSDQAAEIMALAESRNQKIHDAEWKTIIRGKLPYGVTVFFHTQQSYSGTLETNVPTQATWQVGIDGPDSPNKGEPGVYHPIWDDLPAIFAKSETPTNSAALSARAQERADDYFRRLQGGDRLWKRYSGLLRLRPVSTIRAVSWCANTRGVYTDVVQGPGHGMLGVSDSGEWIDCCDDRSTQLVSPDFSPRLPMHPGVIRRARVYSSSLTGYTRTNNTLTSTGTTAFATTIDGVTLALGDRMLLNKTATADNGIYTLTRLGGDDPEWATGTPYKAGDIVQHGGQAYRAIREAIAADFNEPGVAESWAIFWATTTGTATAWTFERSPDADTSAKVRTGLTVIVTEGTSFANTVWRLTTVDPITLNTTALVFTADATPVQWVKISGSSTSMTLVSSGSVTFTVAAGMSIIVGDTVTFTANGSSMTGTVTAYSGTSLTMTVTSSSGAAGTFNSWLLTSGGYFPGTLYNAHLVSRGAIWVRDVNSDCPDAGVYYKAIYDTDSGGLGVWNMDSHNYCGPCTTLVTRVRCVDNTIVTDKICVPIRGSTPAPTSGVTGTFGSGA